MLCLSPRANFSFRTSKKVRSKTLCGCTHDRVFSLKLGASKSPYRARARGYFEQAAWPDERPTRGIMHRYPRHPSSWARYKIIQLLLLIFLADHGGERNHWDVTKTSRSDDGGGLLFSLYTLSPPVKSLNTVCEMERWGYFVPGRTHPRCNTMERAWNFHAAPLIFYDALHTEIRVVGLLLTQSRQCQLMATLLHWCAGWTQLNVVAFQSCILCVTWEMHLAYQVT